MLIKYSAVVFIPGLGFSADVWDRSVLGDRTCIFMDFPDLKNITLNLAVEYVLLKIPDDSIIIAWSLGGLIAIQLAYKYPQKVKKLVLVASQPYFIADTNWQGIQHAVFYELFHLAKKSPDKFIKRFITLVNFPNKNISHKKFLLYRIKPLTHTCWLDYLKMLVNIDLRKSYSELNIPIQHFIGAKDAVVNQNQNKFSLLNNNTRTVTFKEAGHAMFVTHKTKFLKIVWEFMHYG